MTPIILCEKNGVRLLAISKNSSEVTRYELAVPKRSKPFRYYSVAVATLAFEREIGGGNRSRRAV